MTFWLYRKPDGGCDLSDYELPLAAFPGYRLVSTHDVPPVVSGKVFDDQDQLVDADPTPSYVRQRAASYPFIGDQLDMLWHAMDADPASRLEPFYSAIKAVKDEFPKP
jgi:hypothetical protein